MMDINTKLAKIFVALLVSPHALPASHSLLKCVDILVASVGCGSIILYYSHLYIDGASAGHYCLLGMVGVLWHCRNCVVASIKLNSNTTVCVCEMRVISSSHSFVV